MEEELIELERRFWGAAGDPAFYRERFAEDGRCVFGFGVLEKEATMAAVAEAAPWSGVEFADVSAAEIEPDVVVLTYRATGRREDEEPYEALVSSVYVRRNATWQLVLHHQTPYTPTG